MNLEDLKLNIAKDASVDSSELGNEAIRTPQLHSKYLCLHADFKLIHYRNLGAMIFQIDSYKSLGDILNDMENDNLSELGYCSGDEDVVEEFLKVLNNRNFSIKSAIDWFKMTQGIV